MLLLESRHVSSVSGSRHVVRVEIAQEKTAMAVIVEHNETGERFVLVGSGLGMTASARPSLFFGDLLPTEEESTTVACAVCDSEGQIRWIRSASLTVVTIDGSSPSALLGRA